MLDYITLISMLWKYFGSPTVTPRKHYQRAASMHFRMHVENSMKHQMCHIYTDLREKTKLLFTDSCEDMTVRRENTYFRVFRTFLDFQLFRSSKQWPSGTSLRVGSFPAENCEYGAVLIICACFLERNRWANSSE